MNQAVDLGAIQEAAEAFKNVQFRKAEYAIHRQGYVPSEECEAFYQFIALAGVLYVAFDATPGEQARRVWDAVWNHDREAYDTACIRIFGKMVPWRDQEVSWETPEEYERHAELTHRIGKVAFGSDYVNQ
jgi:hypothetical protein